MSEIKTTIASNIIKLRTQFNMTQAELAEKLNYSDKSVSKWERGDGIPDVVVLKSIADIFGVSVDYIISEHEDERFVKQPKPEVRSDIVTLLVILSIWTFATLLFIIFWLSGMILWDIFVYTIPVSVLTYLVLHSVFEKGKNNYFIISAFILSIILTVYLVTIERNWWQLFILVIPAEILVYLSFKLRR